MAYILWNFDEKIVCGNYVSYYVRSSYNFTSFVNLELGKYELGLRRNVQVFAKCNVCISVIQLFFIHKCLDFRPISKYIVNLSYIFPMLGLATIEYWSPY